MVWACVASGAVPPDRVGMQARIVTPAMEGECLESPAARPLHFRRGAGAVYAFSCTGFLTVSWEGMSNKRCSLALSFSSRDNVLIPFQQEQGALTFPSCYVSF